MTWLSGGILFAVGVAVWAAYLLPTMVRRRQEHAAQRSGYDVQFALHAISDSASAPVASVTDRDRLLERKRLDKIERGIERENLRALERAEAERRAAQKQARHEQRVSSSDRRRRLLSIRTLAAWMLLVAGSTLTAGLAAMFFGVTWMVAGAGGMLALAAVITLRLVTRALGPTTVGVTLRVSEQVVDRAPATDSNDRTSSRGWLPTQLPRPLQFAEGSASAQTIAAADAARALRHRDQEIAAAEAEPALDSVAAARARARAMAAHPATYGQRLRERAAGTPALSAAEAVAARYRNGVLVANEVEPTIDVSAVLQRRRAG